jgi:uncharacterized protein YecE (DUF72 family)
MADIRIGISGWTYPPWRKTFFPAGLPQSRELAFASRQLRSIEVNGTFYSLQRPSSYATWFEQTPPDFVFSVKGPRFITHIKRLKDVRAPLANFFASGVLTLAEKLGPILWQLPPSFPFEAERLESFFRLLPRDTTEASKLAREHDARIKSVACEAEKHRPLRHALEIRHESFKTAEFIQLLRDHEIALVVADTAGKWPMLKDATTDWVYARLHGDKQLYVSGYTPAALAAWATQIRKWARGGNALRSELIASPHSSSERDVFVYFDNDVKVRAPYDAMTLAYHLGLGPRPDSAPDVTSIPEVARTSWPRWRRGARTATASPPRRPERRTRRTRTV